MLTTSNIIAQTGVTENEATRLLSFYKKFIFEEFNINMNKIGVSGLVTVFDVDTTSNTIWIGPHTEITSHTSVIRHPYTNVIYGVPNRLSCSDVAIVGTYGVSEEELQTLEDYFYSFVTVSDGINGSQIKREKDISSEVEVFATTTTQEKMRDLVDYNSIISYKRNNYAVL